MKTMLRWWVVCAVALLAACGGGEEAAVGPGHYASGVLTGLKSGNSVLISSGPQSVTLSADGTYRFGRFPTGTVYNVTATSASDTQACTVSNGSGQIGDADIDNIVVNCTDTFSVGGTLSGYSGGDGPVKLQFNGGEMLDVGTNGNFTFSNRLASGAAYMVTLASSPASLICAVTAGSGTVAGGNVTNVAVVCEPATGSIGFSVSGLTTADTVSVQLDGSALGTLPVSSRRLDASANGSYSFTAAVPVGSSYQITIAAQPVNHVCTVVNGSGTFALPGVTNVLVACERSTYTIGGSILLSSGERAVLGLYDQEENEVGQVEVSRAPTNATFDVPLAIPFTFAQRVVSGFSYFVSVIVRPPGNPQFDEKMCYGDNWSGTVGNADVTNVDISCSYTPP